MLDHAHITALDDQWILAGALRPMDDLDAERSPLIVTSSRGALAPPAPTGDRAVIEYPLPVALTGSRWGLVWAEAEPLNGRPDWPKNMFTRLLFSEYHDDEWRTAISVLDADRVLWPSARTVRAGSGHGPLLLTTVIPGPSPGLAFGSPDSALQPIEFEGIDYTWRGSFDVTPEGQMVLVAEAVHRRTHSLVLLRQDLEQWSEPELVHTFESRVVNLAFHLDQAAGEHIFVELETNVLEHFWRPNSSTAWHRPVVHNPSGFLANWVSGIDRCGRLTLITWTPAPPGPLDLAIAHWQDGDWSDFAPFMEGHETVGLFDGTGHDGTWWVGWTGVSSEDSGIEDLAVWIVTP